MNRRSRPIKARRVTFDWSETPLHWVDGDPVTTHVINVLHLLLPAGERWFCNVYRQALPLVDDDEELRGQVKGFIGQEAVHSRAHAEVLRHLKAEGLDTGRYTRFIEWVFETLLGDGRVEAAEHRSSAERPLSRWARRQALHQRLAYIAAIEHFTCVLGAWVLEPGGLDGEGVDPTMVDLLRWHGAEEVEHRDVAYDLYLHVDGSYVRRVLAMALVAPTMLVLWVVGTRFMQRHDPQAPTPGWPATLQGIRQGIVQGRLPDLRLLLRAVPRYMKPGHHPSQEGSTERALQYLGH